MYKFGRRSIKNIRTTQKILQELASRIILRSKFDITVLDNGGLRTADEQNVLFKEGKSKLDGYKKKSYHQSGLAIDLVPYIGNPTWSNKKAFLHIAKIALEEFKNIYTEDYYLHWGGFWSAKDLDGDGILEISDRLGWDMAHFELRTKPQKGVFKL